MLFVILQDEELQEAQRIECDLQKEEEGESYPEPDLEQWQEESLAQVPTAAW
jgi:hypothetical protein